MSMPMIEPRHGASDPVAPPLPFVSVIVPTRDRPQTLECCLQRLSAQDYEPFEVIVIDNSTHMAATREVVSRFRDVIYIREQPERSNPGRMRNMGIERSRGSVLAFVDDDSMVFPGWMQALVAGLATPRVGGVSGRVIEEGQPVVNTPDIGQFYPGGRIVANFNNLISYPVEVGYLYGCNHAISRQALDRAGGYDPWQAMAYEDLELAVRVREHGFTLLYLPGMVVEHLHAPRPAGVARRTGEFDVRSQFLSLRSLAYFSVNHFGLRKELAKTAFVQLPKAAGRAFVKRPSLNNFGSIFASPTGAIVGSFMAILTRLGRHRAPTVAIHADPSGTMPGGNLARALPKPQPTEKLDSERQT
jgi:glycosyltransferase involved in cell wall biosynthesis